jgi:predicted NAD-dependent protein-ADP-ribosyltransferase YbiA (DUF1768 family)
MAAAPDVLFFHSKSARAPPGKGVHERTTRPYPTLAANPRWREALSNFWVSPFQYTDGRRYNSVEHCFQAQKLKIPVGPMRSHGGDPPPLERQLWYSLTMDSFTRVSQADGAAARGMRKDILLSQAEIAYWDSQKEEVMAAAQFAKFSQNGALRDILIATGDAELWHGAARQRPARMWSLERVRAALRAGATAFPPHEEDIANN